MDRRALILVVSMMLAPPSWADSLLIHAASHHANQSGALEGCNQPEYNESNTGVGYVYDPMTLTDTRYEAGIFENSCGYVSAYVAANFEIGSGFSAILGLANNYPYFETVQTGPGQFERKEAGRSFVVPIGQFRYTPRTPLPLDPVIGFGPDRDFDGLLTLSFELRF